MMMMMSNWAHTASCNTSGPGATSQASFLRPTLFLLYFNPRHIYAFDINIDISFQYQPIKHL